MKPNRTSHARFRQHQMGVTDDEVQRALDEPELTYPSHPTRHPGIRCYARGNLAIAVDTHTQTITTVMPRDVTRPRIIRRRDAR